MLNIYIADKLTKYHTYVIVIVTYSEMQNSQTVTYIFTLCMQFRNDLLFTYTEQFLNHRIIVIMRYTQSSFFTIA